MILPERGERGHHLLLRFAPAPRCKTDVLVLYSRVMLIRDLPLVAKDAVLDAFLPVQEELRESAFRKLRREGLISRGIPLNLRGAHGQIFGRPHLYCTLNRDAVRLARHGHKEEARALAARSGSLEDTEAARHVAAVIEAAVQTAGVDLAAINRALRGLARSDEETLRSLTSAIDAARADSPALAYIEKTIYGRVWRLEDELAEVEADDGRILLIPIEDLDESACVGAPVALRWERWGRRRSLLESEPALALGADDFDPFTFGERPLPPAASQALLQKLRMPGMLRVPRPIEIRERA
jgi:hypothetical protein